MSNSYKVPAKNASFELIEKRSRFLAEGIRVDSREEVATELVKLREAHPKANHVCYGFIAGAPSDAQNWGFSDDGEPSGTAGKPILTVLQHSGVGNILVAVVRYFGGVKLGTGGLVRAYGAATKEVLNTIELVKFEVTSSFQIRCAFSRETVIRRTIASIGASVTSCDYSDFVVLSVDLTEKQALKMAMLCEDGADELKALR